MPDYDSFFFNPAAPIAYVTLKNPETGKEVKDVPMLLDTGADATLLPRSFVNKLDLGSESNRIYETEDFEGKKGQSEVVNLQMIFENRNFRGEFLLFNQECGIVGRNILNLLNINFDGKNKKWKIL